MAKGYWIVGLDISDPEQYAEYVKLVRPFLVRCDAKFLVRGGECELVEGVGSSRNVVIEFPSYPDAIAAYQSEEYQAMIGLRTAAASGNFAIVEGF